MFNRLFMDWSRKVVDTLAVALVVGVGAGLWWAIADDPVTGIMAALTGIVIHQVWVRRD